MRNISHADPSQIIQREFDEQLDAKRVVIVGGEMPVFNVQPSINQMQQEVRIEKIEVPTIIVQKELQIVEVEKILIQKEVQIEKIEVPFVVTEIKEVIKEVPVIQHEIRMVEVPVVVKEIQVKDMSKLVKCAIAVHALTTTLLLLKLILK